jgi:hypothetical protein
LNDATEWLQYAHSIVHLLTELIHERGIPEIRRLVIVLEGVAAFNGIGVRCTAQSHLRAQLERMRTVMESAPSGQ